MRTQAQLDGFEASSGIFPLLCAKTLSFAPKRMHAPRANAPIHRTSRAVVVRPSPMNRDDISLAPLPSRPTASFLGLIGSHPAAFCYLKVWPNAGPLTTVRLDALNKSLAPLPGASLDTTLRELQTHVRSRATYIRRHALFHASGQACSLCP